MQRNQADKKNKNEEFKHELQLTDQRITEGFDLIEKLFRQVDFLLPDKNSENNVSLGTNQNVSSQNSESLATSNEKVKGKEKPSLTATQTLQQAESPKHKSGLNPKKPPQLTKTRSLSNSSILPRPRPQSPVVLRKQILTTINANAQKANSNQTPLNPIPSLTKKPARSNSDSAALLSKGILPKGIVSNIQFFQPEVKLASVSEEISSESDKIFDYIAQHALAIAFNTRYQRIRQLQEPISKIVPANIKSLGNVYQKDGFKNGTTYFFDTNLENDKEKYLLKKIAAEFIYGFWQQQENLEATFELHRQRHKVTQKISNTEDIFPATLSFHLIKQHYYDQAKNEDCIAQFCLISLSGNNKKNEFFETMRNQLNTYALKLNENYEVNFIVVNTVDPFYQNLVVKYQNKLGEVTKQIDERICSEFYAHPLLFKLYLQHGNQVKIVGELNISFYPYEKRKRYGSKPLDSIDRTVKPPTIDEAKGTLDLTGNIKEGDRQFFLPVVSCCEICSNKKPAELLLFQIAQHFGSLSNDEKVKSCPGLNDLLINTPLTSQVLTRNTLFDKLNKPIVRTSKAEKACSSNTAWGKIN